MRRLIVLFLAALIALPVMAAQPLRYSVVLLPNSFGGTDLSDNREVAGGNVRTDVYGGGSYFEVYGAAYRVANGGVELVYEHATPSFFGGVAPSGGKYVGFELNEDNDNSPITPAVFSVLGTQYLKPELTPTVINDAGTVAGSQFLPDDNDPYGGTQSLFRLNWDGSLQTLDTQGYVAGLSNDGSVAYTSFTLDSPTPYQGVTGLWLPGTNGSKSFGSGSLTSISPNGSYVCGQNDRNMAALWGPNGAVELRSMGRDSALMDVNSNGEAVGYRLVGFGRARRAIPVLYSGGRVLDVSRLVSLPRNWRIVSAGRINNGGDILVTIYDTAFNTSPHIMSMPPPSPYWTALLLRQ